MSAPATAAPAPSGRAIENLIATYAELVDNGDFTARTNAAAHHERAVPGPFPAPRRSLALGSL
jgi:hypothetical protein